MVREGEGRGRNWVEGTGGRRERKGTGGWRERENEEKGYERGEVDREGIEGRVKNG